MARIILYFILLYLIPVCLSCHSPENDSKATGEETVVQTPVTVTSVTTGPLIDYLELNATSAFLQSNIVKASATGYIKSVNVSPGQFVAVGRSLFIIETKEAKNIGTIINNLDTTFRFSGNTHIKASQSGYVTQLNHQAGDYVQDGEQLAAISTEGSFGFILNIPFELARFAPLNKAVEVDLPDGTKRNGRISSILPAVDSVSQTQRMLIRINSTTAIPENLIVKVKIIKTQKNYAVVVTKEALLSDESQTNFWVMKLIDSVTAVKVPVTKGLEVNNKVEIVQPLFSSVDRILTSGNYGLPDTAKVKIVGPVE